MNADLSWGEVRWGEQRSSPSAKTPTMATSTTLAVNRPISADADEAQHNWPNHSFRDANHEIYAPQAYPYTQAPSRLLDNLRTETRTSSQSATKNSHMPRVSPNASPRPKSEEIKAGSISERPDRQNAATRRISELQIIPGTFAFNELPKFGTTDRVSPPSQTTLLPSFASLEESTNCDDRQKVALHHAGKSDTHKCRGCVEKTAAIDDIALSTTDLDEALQAHGSESGKTKPQRPQECSLRTAQWVLERLRDARAIVQASVPSLSLGQHSQQPLDKPKPFPSRSLSPPGAIKRPSDTHESDELHHSKRQRTSSHTDHYLDSTLGYQQIDHHRRASESLQRIEPTRTYSPSLSDSWRSSVQSRQLSPGAYARSLRPLPSPSSLATTSHKPSWTGLSLPPGSSPTAAHQSLHSSTTSTAASQHIADLQHQVTLKSLALQTLQSEYTSLLQKFQRDRLRSQTFEKKTVAADQEINALTKKNEELTDQIKALETQLEECEKRREAERSDSAREKDQWGKMLEMSGRLQAKGAEDRQKLLQEKESLQQRLQIHENEAALSASRKARSSPKASLRINSDNDITQSLLKDTGSFEHETADQLAALQRENAVLQTRTGMLRTALERVENQHSSMVAKRREIMEQEAIQIPSVVKMALQEDSTFARPVERQRSGSWSARDAELQVEMRQQPTAKVPPKAHPQIALVPTHTGDRVLQGSLRSPPAPAKNDNHTETQPKPPTQRQSQDISNSVTRPKLQTIPIPKWQPPSASTLRTDHIANNQRRPSGPSTPYPGAESQAWQSFDCPPAHSKAPVRKPSLSTQLPVFATEKTPARDYTPHYAPPSPGGTEKQRGQDVAATMPPPPRPTSGPSPSTVNTVGSWRPSE